MKNLDTTIENYLTGNLPADEVSKFEQFLSQNPDAQSQLDLQKDIIEGIKQMRKNELKSKLSSIDPKAGSNPIIQKLAIAATTLVGTAIVSIGIYTASYDHESSTPAVNNTTDNQISSVIETQPETPVNQTIPNDLTQENKEEELVTNEVISPEVIESPESNKPTVSMVNTPTEGQITPSHSPRPNVFMDVDEGENDPDHENIEEPNSSSIGQNIAEGSTLSYSIDTDCTSDENGYTYSGMKLQLCGDFNKSEFTIYKDAVEDNFYFAYENNYYKIVESNKFEKFSHNKLTSSKVIKRLVKK